MGHLLARLPGQDNPNLLVGYDTSDDAGVYRIGENLALVQTVDLITPVCDDARLFGRIAAANALSDIYAMGGRPITALNICCFPAEGVPPGIYAEILTGGLETLGEAGAALLGGHSVRDTELKYGLAVTGMIDPARILRNATATAGCALVLTKPIGTGVIVGAARKDLVPEKRLRHVLDRMATLNDEASRQALAHGAVACTDVTGFGLAGHALEMARGSGVGLRIRMSAVPLYEEAPELIRRGVTTAVTDANRALAGSDIRIAGSIDGPLTTLLFDPQTSGGLLIALPSDRADALVAALRSRGAPDTSLVGEVVSPGGPPLEILPG